MAINHGSSPILDLSIGIFLLIVGTIVIGSVFYYKIKKKKEIIDITDLSSEKEKYETNKWIVEDAIRKNDIEKLKRLQNNPNIVKHNKLSKLIEDFLNINNN